MRFGLLSSVLLTLVIVVLGVTFWTSDAARDSSIQQQREQTLTEPTTPDVAGVEKTRELSLTLPAEEIEETLTKEIPLEPIAPLAKSGESTDKTELLNAPVSVELSDDDTPVINYHFQKKAEVAKKADLADSLDGIETDDQ